MKLLHVIPSVDPASGGPAEGLKQLCRAYQQSGYEIEVASLDSARDLDRIAFPVKVFPLGPGLGIYGYSAFAAAWFHANIACYDVVLINGIWQYGALAAYRALIHSDVPYGVFPHGMLDPYFKTTYPLKHLKKTIYWHLFLRKILLNAAAVSFTSEQERVSARESFPQYKANERVVTYGIYAPNCSREVSLAEFHARWPDLHGKRIALLLGRIHPKKGVDLLIEAFSSAMSTDPEWRLVIAGPDECGLQSKLAHRAATLGIADKICWTGMLTGAEKWGAFAAAEVFVLPSHQENFAVVIAEAMACSVPVIVSNRVNTWREVVKYEAGLACEDTVEGLRSCLQNWQMLRLSEIDRMRARSRQCFDDLFDYSSTSSAAMTIVNEIAGAQRPGVHGKLNPMALS
jgi:glycosyltransferase involved in cell wall biosynthesis